MDLILNKAHGYYMNELSEYTWRVLGIESIYMFKCVSNYRRRLNDDIRD